MNKIIIILLIIYCTGCAVAQPGKNFLPIIEDYLSLEVQDSIGNLINGSDRFVIVDYSNMFKDSLGNNSVRKFGILRFWDGQKFYSQGKFIPHSYLEKDSSIFYLVDWKTKPSDKMVEELKQQGIYEVYDFNNPPMEKSYHGLKSVNYFICPNNWKKFEKVISSKLIEPKDYPVLNCE